MPRPVRLALALALTTAIVLVGIEWGLETAAGLPRKRAERELERQTGRPMDRRRITEVVRDLRAAGTPAVPSIVPTVIISHTMPESPAATRYGGAALPLGGISRRPTIHLCNEDGRFPIYHSDRYGFANPDSVWDLAPARLLLIGDSFTHGYCVPDDSTLGARLRALEPRTINLASGGSGPLSELAALTEYLPAARPGSVLWFFYENDLRDLAAERRHPLLARYLDDGFGQGLPGRQAEIDRDLQGWVDSIYRPGLAGDEGGRVRRLLTLYSLRRLVRSFRSRSDFADQLPLFRQVMQRAGARADAAGSRLVMVFLPSWERWYNPRGEIDLRDSVLASANALGIPVIDLTPAFEHAADRPALFARGTLLRAHYSPRGYSLVADTVLGRLSPSPRLPVSPSSSKNPR